MGKNEVDHFKTNFVVLHKDNGSWYNAKTDPSKADPKKAKKKARGKRGREKKQKKQQQLTPQRIK